ncbi:type 1 glutamine amidotransferase [Desulfosarcina sp.]|uniref:type 1 glutamine amidotransferase n=1 Tax=Desulfosarcina sp. TaxID=2027861 RepID=UPI0029A7129E|nr:type 1 glutamine amidotransferase [Desulfosarcina sp.]MDX2453836.1 type 1 glutamine amidotransferase [Desulfosarcina sp.]MDX2491536.1 type 1 glutamine amidotransferase [Desulfosarcina sp.]
MKIHWLQHVAFEGLGSIAGWAAENGCPVSGSRMFAGDALPANNAFDLLVIMGGPMSVNDEVVHPWLVDEKRYVAQAMAAGKMVLGICLGAQMIASANGARVYPNDYPEIGWFPVKKTKAAKKMPVGHALADKTEVFHWHGETFDLPHGAVHLARNRVCENQAFAMGQRIVGLQYHLETTPESARALIQHCRHELVKAPHVQTESEIQSQPNRFWALNREMDRLLDYFISIHRTPIMTE